jgi:hypothetical protein
MLREACGVDAFIEGGTFRGDTTAWAAEHFSRVVSIEFSKTLYDAARERFRDERKIELRFGDSRAVLAELVPALDAPAMFWLDSHWSGGATYGENDECPLLEELRVLASSPIEHVVLVDDARLFLAPPPLPHRFEQWPPIDVVLAALRHPGRESYVVIHDDVIVRAPIAARDAVARFCQERATEAWERSQKKRFRLFG